MKTQNDVIFGNGRLTRRNPVEFFGDDYRVVTGYPLDKDGNLICPACGEPEKSNVDVGMTVQYGFLDETDKYHYYCKCSACNLRYVWTDLVGKGGE